MKRERITLRDIQDELQSYGIELKDAQLIKLTYAELKKVLRHARLAHEHSLRTKDILIEGGVACG